MQRAEVVVGALRKRAEKLPAVSRLYRHLFNPDLYRDAGASPVEIREIVTLLRSESYRPGRGRGGGRWDALVELALGRLLDAVLGLDGGWLPDLVARARVSRELACVGSARWAWVGVLDGDPDAPDEEEMCRALGERVRDGRILELCRRLLRANGRLSLPARVYRELELMRWDRLAKGQREVLEYVRCGTSFLMVGLGRMEWLREALADPEGNQLVFGGATVRAVQVDMARRKPQFMGYRVLRRPGGLKLELTDGAVRERLHGFVRGQQPVRRCDRVNLSVAEIVGLYRAELMRFCVELGCGGGRRQLRRFRYYHLVSMMRTLASKGRVSVRAMRAKCRANQEGMSSVSGRSWGEMVPYPALTREGGFLY